MSLSIIPTAGAQAAGSTTLTIDPAVQGKPIGVLSDTITSWDLGEDWTTKASAMPTDYFATNYPEITTADLFGATGGGYTSQAEALSYYVSNLTTATITALFQTSVEPAANLKFWSATTDPETFQQITGFTIADTPVAGGAWTKRVYTVTGIPAGTTILRIAFPTGGANAYNPQLSSVALAADDSFTDELDDWSHVGAHSDGLTFDTGNADLVGDSSRLMRTVNNRYTASESVTYQSTSMSELQATALFSSTDENIDDLTFFASPDNESWSQVTDWTNTDVPIGSWTKRSYSLSSLPAGTEYLRVTFPTGGLNSWNPLLGQVVVSGDADYTDELDDWSKSYYHTSGLDFDFGNADVFGDAGKIRRTNNYDGFPKATVNRDLFKNPQDRNVLDDYDFTRLITATHNIVDQGLKPKIRLANIPLKFTSTPEIGAFRTNIRPPDDYDAYYAYIKAIADALKAEFGLEEVSTWTWGMTPEIENASWLLADDNTAASTEAAFFAIYDYSVAALEDSLGADNVKVGVHAMNQGQGLWDPLDFIDHVASGTNLKTGQTGTQLDYVDFSYYEGGAGNTGQLEPNPNGARGLTDSVEHLRARALADGLTSLTYGVAESGIGFDGEGRFILNGILASGYEGSLDALIFKKLNDSGIRDWSRWALNTEKIWGGVPGISSSIDKLAARMTGETRIDVTRSGAAADASNILDATASVDSAGNEVHVMAFNHNPQPSASGAEDLTVAIPNIEPASGDSVTVTKWVVDDSHGSFWSQWWADRQSHGVSDATVNNYSPQSLTVPTLMTVQSDKDYWYSREADYQALAALSSTTSTVTPTNGTVTLTDSVAQHGVVFYEISNAKVVSSPVSSSRVLSDDLDNWYQVNSHSTGLAFDTSNAAVFSDSSRVNRTDQATVQTVDYAKLGAKSATISAIFGTDLEQIADFAFSTSPDGTSWTPYTGWTNTDTVMNSGNSTVRQYSLNALPDGTNYLRIAFPTGGQRVWNPQLAKVTIVAGTAVDPGDPGEGGGPTGPGTPGDPGAGGTGGTGTSPDGSGSAAASAGTSTGLAQTGATVAVPLIVAALLLCLGATAIILRRRRRHG
jgi:LPXTG-motif cell wall-anchored protein